MTLIQVVHITFVTCTEQIPPIYIIIILCAREKHAVSPASIHAVCNTSSELCSVISVLNTKIIILLSLAEYHLILANSTQHLVCQVSGNILQCWFSIHLVILIYFQLGFLLMCYHKAILFIKWMSCNTLRGFFCFWNSHVM